MLVSFEKPSLDNLTYVANNMREADIVEVLASGATSPLDAILTSVERSCLCTVAAINDKPCAVFGVVSGDVLTGTGVPWLLGTDLLTRYPKSFIQHTSAVVDELLERYMILENYVHADNKVSIRWLRAMGFELGESEPIGVNGELFMRFWMRKI